MNRGRDLAFDSSANADEALRLAIRVRFAEALEAQSSLYGSDDEAIHAFRLCCKRLRYALERVDAKELGLEGPAELLERVTDTLGAAHDCVVLGERARELECYMLPRRARRDRDAYVAEARALWRGGLAPGNALEALAVYAGFLQP